MPDKLRELRKERRHDLKMGRFSLQSDVGRVWSSSGLFWATLWGEGGYFAPSTNGSIPILLLTPCLPPVMQAALPSA
jgi:hypothetical protein